MRSMREFLAHVPWKVAMSHWNNLDSHDTARIRTLVRDKRLVRVAIGLLMTFPGVPMTFAGDEQDAVGSTGEQSRVTMDWDSPDDRYEETSSVYRGLLELRRRYSALRAGGLRWVGSTADMLGYLREDGESRLLVAASRVPDEHLIIDEELIGSEPPLLLFGQGRMTRVEGHRWLLTMPEPAICIWRFPAGRSRAIASDPGLCATRSAARPAPRMPVWRDGVDRMGIPREGRLMSSAGGRRRSFP